MNILVGVLIFVEYISKWFKNTQNSPSSEFSNIFLYLMTIRRYLEVYKMTSGNIESFTKHGNTHVKYSNITPEEKSMM